MTVNQLSAYFFPQKMTDWNAEHIREAKRLSAPLHSWGRVLQIFGTIGTFFASYKLITFRFKGIALTNSLIFIGITSIALLALGIYLKRLAHRHCEGLSQEQSKAVAIDELKQVLTQLPVCQSENEFQEKLAKDADFNYSTADKALEKVNEIHYLASPLYCPVKDLQPRFQILSSLTVAQHQDLLDTAYQKGIILHFDDYMQFVIFEFPKATLEYQEGRDKRCSQNMKQAFICSVQFLATRVISLDSIRIDLINEQLRALGFKWWKRSTNEVKVFNPTIYLENKDTVVIRGNCSETGDIEWAIDLLAPHFKQVKIEKKGLLFVNRTDSDVLYFQENFQFPYLLKLKYRGKIEFVDELVEMPTIWQKEYSPQEPGWKEIMNDLSADQERQKKIRQAQV